MIDTKALRNKILDAAIRGKLTEQLPEDGNAEDLYQQIQAEKQKLIKEGKIKKEKPLPEITDGEIPFDIPDNWKWVKISDIVNYQEGPGILAKDFRRTGVPLIRISGMEGKTVTLVGCNFLDPLMVQNKWSHFKLKYGDILLSTSASMDKICEVKEEAVDAIPYTGQIRFRMYKGLDKKYFVFFVKSTFYRHQIEQQAKGVGIMHYGPSHLHKMIIPLPPLSEQKRIAEKVESLFYQLDLIDKLQNQMSDNASALRNKLIELGIEGKLTEQLPGDGDAEDLYREIQAEKQRLINEGKIKKEKNESYIFRRDNSHYEKQGNIEHCIDDEIPFKIPENWKWLRLGMLIHIESGKNLTTADMHGGQYPVYGGNGINGYHDKSLVDKNTVIIGRVGFYCGSIHVTSSKAWITDNAFIATYPTDYIDIEYLVHVLQFMDLGKDNSNATAQPVISGKRVYTKLFPLPPLAEQKRIITKLNQLLSLCDSLSEIDAHRG